MIGLAAWAMAQTPPAEPPEPSDEDLEIIVYGELLVEQARSAVVQELEEAGYDHRVIDLGDRVVYRHSLSYHGEVVVHDDGYVQVRRQPLHAVGRQMPWARENTPLAWAGCLLWPWACVRVYGFTVSDRRWRSRETKTVQRIEPKVREWGNRIADLSTSQKVDSMSGLLEQLWVRGEVPRGRGARLVSRAPRLVARLLRLAHGDGVGSKGARKSCSIYASSGADERPSVHSC